MKTSILIILILVVAVGGAIGIQFIQSNLPNTELVNRDVNDQLLKLDTLNSSINELVLRSRANLDLNYDMLVRSTSDLENGLSGLSSSHFRDNLISGSLLNNRFNTYETLVEVKVDQIENFKSHNSILRNSEKYIPLVGNKLATTATQQGLSDIATFYQTVIMDMFEFNKQGSIKPISEVIDYSQQIRDTESAMPTTVAIEILEFANHVSTAIEAKRDTDLYLNAVLSAVPNDRVDEISAAWNIWRSENADSGTQLRNYKFLYFALLAVLLALLAFKLRSLFKNQGRQIDLQSEQVKTADEKLKETELALELSEEEASAKSKVISTLTTDINEPLVTALSKVQEIKAKFDLIVPVIAKAESISDNVADKSAKKTDLKVLLKEQIVAFRRIDEQSKPQKISALIEDASESLITIKGRVNSTN